jgi:hypothetical protein
MTSDRSLRLVVCGLLVVSAALFAIGVAIERHDTRAERAGLPRPLLLADSDQGTEEVTIGAATPRRREKTERREHRETTTRSGRETPAERSPETGTRSGQERELGAVRRAPRSSTASTAMNASSASTRNRRRWSRPSSPSRSRSRSGLGRAR